jgi:hypothetical protein
MRLDGSEYQSTDDLKGSGNRPAPGRYHVAINSCEEGESSQKHTPGVNVEVVVLAGTVPGQEGKTVEKFMAAIGGDDKKTKTCQKALFSLAHACGLIQFGESKDVDFSGCAGRECICEVVSSPYVTKDGRKVDGSELNTFSWLALNDPKAAAVPKDYTSPGMRAYEGKVMAGSTAPPAAETDEYDV